MKYENKSRFINLLFSTYTKKDGSIGYAYYGYYKRLDPKTKKWVDMKENLPSDKVAFTGNCQAKVASFHNKLPAIVELTSYARFADRDNETGQVRLDKNGNPFKVLIINDLEFVTSTKSHNDEDKLGFDDIDD